MYITKKQKQVLDYIREYVRDNDGVAPTYEEIAEHFGYRSKGTVHKHITNLEEKGYIKKDWNRTRGLEIVKQENGNGISELPLLGLVAAGEPIEAIENAETIVVPDDMIGKGDNYVLQVRGNSMIDENIQNNDYVIVQPRKTAENGETVIALIGGQDATLKKFYQEGDRVRLQPANAAMNPIYAPAKDVQIRGVVVGVMRKFQ